MIDISKDGVKGRSPIHTMCILLISDKQIAALAADRHKKNITTDGL